MAPLLDLDSYGDNDPLGMFPFFQKRTAVVLAPRLAVVLRRLLRLGSFPFCWRVANVTQFQRVNLPSQWPITEQFP